MSNLLGNRFGKLVVFEEYSSNNRSYCKCQCDCGNIKITRKDALTGGKTNSCGCLRQENVTKKMSEKYLDEDAAKLKSAKCLYNDVYSDGNLTFEDFLQLSQQNCFYCNAPPSNKHNGFKKKSTVYNTYDTHYAYTGLDRINTSLPHNVENLIPCCFQCNFAKNDMTIKEFIEWLRKLE